MARREILDLPGDILDRILQPAFNSKLGCLVYSIPLVVGVGLAASSCADSLVKETQMSAPAPSCLMDGRPTPSERAYSSTMPDGSSVSLSPNATVFIAETCPPSSR
jgi:hypothetical protein